DNAQGDEEDDGGIVINKTFQACHSGITCLEIDFAKRTFKVGTTFSFNVNFAKNVTVVQLTGTHHTVVTDDLLATTSTFEGCGECSSVDTDSQYPDPTVAVIIVNPARFAAFGAPPSFTGCVVRACTVPLGDSAAIIG